MLVAQELPPVDVTVEATTDPVSLIVSLLAVAIAAASFIVTWRQGREIRNIETREHEWQAEDRVSAHIEITRITETRPRTFRKSSGAETHYSTSDRIRVRNTGRAEARDVEWSIDQDNVFVGNQRTALDVLYPGEHYEMILALSAAHPPDGLFTVKWSDGNGDHESTRIINL